MSINAELKKARDLDEQDVGANLVLWPNHAGFDLILCPKLKLIVCRAEVVGKPTWAGMRSFDLDRSAKHPHARVFGYGETPEAAIVETIALLEDI